MAHRFTRPRLGLLTTSAVAALAAAPATAQISTPAPQAATQAAQAEEAAPPADTGPESDGAELFLNVDNVFNKDPVIAAPFSQPILYAPINGFLYDTIGRNYRFGFRYRM